MAINPLTPEEQRLVNRMIHEMVQEEIELERQGKTRADVWKEQQSKPENESVDLADIAEDTTDEILMWCARRRFSRWIVTIGIGAIFAMGWYANQYYHPIRDAVLHWIG